jgi:hypothetical protein
MNNKGTALQWGCKMHAANIKKENEKTTWHEKNNVIDIFLLLQKGLFCYVLYSIY